ncbi:hypothetical protein [Methylomonas methanica]|uniref:Porin domain-containing protein n=1 Tax=Methylomonas methanica (strain DSM 25384 / MC09) TaxID=857087 RepID=F9ZXB6_METMM|nr:hypothetical protein [Methylomonas methanica]AEF99726.1 hypothetical protein Metme_1300 [Methylomonas methanica MC09]
MNINIFVIAASLFMACLTGFAEESKPTLSLKGFGTLGASGTDNDSLKFRRDIKQGRGVGSGWGIDTDSRLGLQVDADFNNAWHATVQWVARNYTGDFVEQNLDWAFLRWQPLGDLDIRVGRMGFDVFMLSEYRDVGYAYPWVRPPHEFYAGLPVYHFDGMDIAKKFAVGDGQLTFKMFGGYSFNQVPIGLSSQSDQSYSLAGAKLAYELGNWNARIGYNYSVNNLELSSLRPLMNALNDPALSAVWPDASTLAGKLSSKGKAVHFTSIGLAYDDGQWLAQAEGSYIYSELNVYTSVASGYLSVGRRVGKVTLYSLLGISETLNSRVDVSAPLAPVPALQTLRNATDLALNTNGIDEKSVSLGLRWDVTENVDLKAQWSHYWLGNNGNALWLRPPTGAVADTVNVWSVGMDFIF